MRTTTIPAAFVAVVALGLVCLTTPAPVAACSCVPPDMIIEDIGTSDQVAFVGKPGAPNPGGIPVAVASWFRGPAPAPVVTLAVEGGDGASCGTNGPPPGGAYLFVASPNGDGRYAISLCSVVADLSTPEGQAMLAQTTRILGAPSPVGGSPPEPSSDVGQTITDNVPLALGIMAAIGIVGGLFVFVGRRED
jgi:hypothetical protein